MTKPETSSDRPNVVIFPPAILAGTLLISCVLQWFAPLGVLAALEPAWRIALGAAVITGGIALAAAGRRTLTRLGTNVSPLQPTTTIATGGVYGWTRNPLYTGGTLLLLGLALVFALGWLPLLLVPALTVLHFGVVRREEDYLQRKFGDAYATYSARVSRYGIGF